MGAVVDGWVITKGLGTYGTDYLKRAVVAAFGWPANQQKDAVYPYTEVDSAGVNLLLAGFGKTVAVQLDVQAARQQHRAIVKGTGVKARGLADGTQVFVEALAVEAGLVQILRGAHEHTWHSAHRPAEGRKSAAGFRRQERQHLLRILRNGHNDPFLLHLPRPRF